MNVANLAALRARLSKGRDSFSPELIAHFQSVVLAFYRDQGRTFPWRETRDPYCILVSEFMLQQTQTHRVASKYVEFLARFPTIQGLAESDSRSVIEAWQGLGYNRRAMFLRDAAIRIVGEYGGIVPHDPEVLRTFRGIGPATASEIAAFAYGVATSLVETNIRRVFIHLFAPGDGRVADKDIMDLVETTLDRQDPRTWYYALMDFGAWLKVHLSAQGIGDPNRRSGSYSVQSRFEGSDRQIRGRILRLLLDGHPATEAGILEALGAREAVADRRGAVVSPERTRAILEQLAAEGFLRHTSGHYRMV